VSGGGISCSGSSGVTIFTDGSSPGVSYQLFDGGGAPFGSPIGGSGFPLTFGPYTTEGDYTLVGTNTLTGCSATMPGGATISDSMSPGSYTVTGGGPYCIGSAAPHVGLNPTDPGISYQLYKSGVAVGSAIIGSGSSIDFGVISTAGMYSVIAIDPASACTSEMADSVLVTPNPVPAIFSLGAGGGYCRGTSGLPVTLSGSVAGISYQLYDGGVAHGTPMIGTGSSLNFGFDTSGTYTIKATNTTTGCTSTMTGSTIISSTLLAPSVNISIAPGGVICNGETIGFAALPVNGGATPAYTWLVNGAVAGTGSTHVYVPSNGDIVSVLMASSLPCATPDSAIISDTLSVDIPHITASSTSACGGFVSLSGNGGSTYVWSPASGLSCPTCDTITVNPNSTVIYTLTGTDIYGCVGTMTITANGNRIAGHISGLSTFGSIRVWLIQFNPADSSLITLDSTMNCLDDGAPYYEFDNYPAGSYLVRAEVLGGVPGSSGYIPTYGMSSTHWEGSSAIIHGSSTDTMHITMLYGIIYPGPGSIGGSIVSGAGRATSLIPAEGMLVYLQDAVSGNVLTYTYTNSAGQYSFSGLAYGSYIVYPEQYDYYTIPAYVITLTSVNSTVPDVFFRQHTSYRIITPYLIPQAVAPLSTENGLTIYPNPTSGNLNVQWTNQLTGSADVIITDVVGRDVYKSVIDINAASGETQLGLTGLKDGIYIINIKSPNLNYSGKLIIQQ